MTNRRKVIKTIGLGASTFFLAPKSTEAKSLSQPHFRYCLNTSTISGQNPGILRYIEIAAQAGYDGIELWIGDIQAFLKEGNPVTKLRKHLEDHQLKLENAIGFAPWMAEDETTKKKGFAQMKDEMEILAELGGKRIAAPGIGANAPVDLFRAGQSYKELLDLGRSTGVMPQLEFWGAFDPFYHLGQTLMVAAVANDPDARFLPDVYHLFRGGSGFEGLKLLNGRSVEIFHLNDYPGDISREKQEDKDRVYPGDGVAPMTEIIQTLQDMGGPKVLSLELFNPTYWKEDPLTVAQTGLKKMKEQVSNALAV
jgi:2-keto-myo-inositol isomerase